MKTIPLLVVVLIALTACTAAPMTPPPSVVGDWKLVAYGSAANPTPALPNLETSMQFDENGQFNGAVGCNTLGGGYQLDGERITFGAIFSTRMACPGIMEQEYGVLGILSEKRLSITFDENQMTLTSDDGASVVVLSRQ